MSRQVDLLHPWYWPEVRRGSERVLHDLATELAALGQRPRLLVGDPRGFAHELKDGVEIQRLWRPLDGRGGRQPGSTHVPFAAAALRLRPPELAHAFHITDATATTAWARRTGRPSVFSLMGVPRRETLASHRGRLQAVERAAHESDAVLVLGRTARDALYRWLGVEAEIIPPGVDLAAFSPGRERASEPTIVCAADVTDPRKRVELLVRAFARVRRERPTARLLLDAPADPAARFDAPGIEWHTDGPAAMFREAWVSGLTSEAEAFGLVLVESLACGTPVFGSRDGGAHEIVDRPEIGRLFDEPEEQDVARAMLEALELAEDPATAATCRARAQDFTTRRTAQAHLALYERLLRAG